MKIQLIWAQDLKGGIGKKGKLPWYIPEDLKNFKKITSSYPVIMGRITWESLTIKPLTNRRNIVLSKKKLKDIESYNNVEICLKKLKKDKINSTFIIGGANVYSCFIDIATDLHITLINEIVEGIDCFFPTTLSSLKEKFIINYEEKISEKAVYSHWIKK